MTTRPQKTEGHGNVVQFDPNHRGELLNNHASSNESDNQSAPQEQSQSSNSPPRLSRSNAAWIIATAVFLILVVVSLFQLTANNNLSQELEASGLELKEMETAVDVTEVELRQTKGQLAEEMKARLTAEDRLGETELELALSTDRLSVMVTPEVAAELEAELNDAKSVIDVQTEVIEQYKLDNDILEDQLQDQQAATEAAKAEAYRAQVTQSTESLRAAELAAALDVAHMRVASNAEAGMRSWGGDLTSKVYYLGTVEKPFIRDTFFWDDEYQFFRGTGEIRFLTNLEQVRFKLLDDQMIQAILPLPTVDEASHVALVGETWTEREQAARWGARWGEQTEWLVSEKAQLNTRNLACADVPALRREMSKVLNTATKLTNGYQLQVKWIDNSGVMRTNVNDEQLLASAC